MLVQVDEKSFPLPKGEAQSRDVLPEDVRKILRGLDKPFDSFSAEVGFCYSYTCDRLALLIVLL